MKKFQHSVKRVLLSALGTGLVLVVMASLEPAGLTPEALAQPAPPASPLSVRQISAHEARGRLIATATVVHHGNGRIRSTTAVLAITPGPGDKAIGVRTVRVHALAAGRSQRVRFTTRPLRALHVASGEYQTWICTDVYSQIQQFAAASNCSAGPRGGLRAARRHRASGPVPKTILKAHLPHSTTRSSAVLRFTSTVAGSRFECRLDGAPWLPCRSPQRYTALAGSPHTFAVRAISRSGRPDPTPAHTAWTVRTPLKIRYRGTDRDGVASYDFTSTDDGYGTHVLRVLAPTDPTPGVAHNFLYVLPVEPELGTQFGDGIETMREMDAQNRYNLTIVEPSFAVDPWYADDPRDSQLHYETFMTKDLVPWVTRHLSAPADGASPARRPQNWLIGFSKSGLGAQDLILKHPDVFTLAASWDFPAGMTAYNEYGPSSAGQYGTNANFQDNYRLTPGFLDAHKGPFTTANRIWIGGYKAFRSDVADYDALLTSEGIQHTTAPPQEMDHRWDSGWAWSALAALSKDSAALPATP